MNVRHYFFAAYFFIFMFLCTGCSSFSSFESPRVNDAGSLSGMVAYSQSGLVECNTKVGVGKNFDVGLKFPLLTPILSVHQAKLFPMTVDVKYQILAQPFYVAAGLGWNYLREGGLFHEDTISHSWSPFILLGSDHVYGGIRFDNIKGSNDEYKFSNSFSLPGNRQMFSIIIGASIGKKFRLVPEILLTTADNGVRTHLGLGIELRSE